MQSDGPTKLPTGKGVFLHCPCFVRLLEQHLHGLDGHTVRLALLLISNIEVSWRENPEFIFLEPYIMP